ncbi:MAG TPA: UDP-N-acetylglucosamine 1-carboxyvinyltransferase [Pirellulales bacterium]|jgi:UDP-N-acetylglucosamine 1-carboxyvinyltransferase
MDAFQITGGVPLVGAVDASGAKNAALPIMAAAILADEPVLLDGVPDLLDVATLSRMLRRLGVSVRHQGVQSLRLENKDATLVQADGRLMRRMRASFCVLGPLVARRRQAIVPLPGGCAIGDRPVDLHLRGLAALGADIQVRDGCVVAQARRLTGARIHLSGPWGPTVTGTANVLSAATLARGTTVITGAATEPEIVDLGKFLTRIGARIEGLGTQTIVVEGIEQLGGGGHRVIPDRIEAATLLCAGAITGGQVTVRGVIAEHMTAVLEVLADAGFGVRLHEDSITLTSTTDFRRPIQLTARPYPHVPTDMQSQFTALASLIPGRSQITDQVFPQRFHHVRELARLGAKVRRTAGGAIVTGVSQLEGARVVATDLRASASLVLAGLAAEGMTVVHRIGHLERGYERLDEKLNNLGAQVERLDSRGNEFGSAEKSHQQSLGNRPWRTLDRKARFGPESSHDLVAS